MCKNLKFKNLLILITVIVISGCVTETTVTKNEMNEIEKTQEPPEQRITRYEDALIMFGEMLEAYNAPKINIQTKAIENATSSTKVPNNISQMVITALNKIGNKISYVDFDAQRLLTEQALGKIIDLSLIEPDIIIRGAITEFDKDLIRKGKELKGDYLTTYQGQELDMGAEAESEATGSQIAIDLQVMNYNTKRLVPGAQTSNKINIFKTSNALELGVAYNGSGLGFNCSVERQQGLYSSLRLLVELSVLELLGEYYDVPYWRCIPDASPDNRMLTRYRKSLKDDSNIAIKLKILAFGHGKKIDLTTASFTEQDQKSFNELKSSTGITDDYDLYIELWKTLPIKEAAQRLKIANKQMAQQSPPEPEQIQVEEQQVQQPIQETVQPQEKNSTTTEITVNDTKTIGTSINVKTPSGQNTKIKLNKSKKSVTGFNSVIEDDF